MSGGGIALVAQDTLPLFSSLQTRAKARALLGAALAGVVLGVLVGGAYLAGVQTQAAQQRTRIGPLAEAARIGYLVAAAAPVPAAIQLANNDPSSAPAAPPAKPRVRPATPFRPTGASEGSAAIDCLSAAVYYEARGESAEGQAAVAQVVLNRARQPSYPKSVCGVVYQGCQFSFACNGATRGVREPGAWLRARTVAARALGGYVMAAVGRATSFHAGRGAHGAIAQVGGHVFFGGGGRIRGEGRAMAAEEKPSAPGSGEIAATPAAPATAITAALAPSASSTAS